MSVTEGLDGVLDIS